MRAAFRKYVTRIYPVWLVNMYCALLSGLVHHPGLPTLKVEKDRKKQVGARYKQTDKQIQNSINEQVKDLMNGSVKPIKANIQKAEKK